MVTELDVVTRTADHQCNLTPAALRQRSAILALPRPLICRWLEPTEFEKQRSQKLELQARALGLGDGPTPVVDLDADQRSLVEILEDLDVSGVRNIAVFGAIDQPGFARALAFRWPFGLELAADSTWNMIGSLPAGTGSRVLPSSLRCGDDASSSDVALGTDASAGLAAGIVPGRGLFAGEQALRQAWLDKWSVYGVLADASRAVLGVDEQLEQRLCSAAPARPPERGRLIAVAGLDGAGKSCHAARLVLNCRALGLASRSMKLYRQGTFLRLADEVSARTRSGAPLSNFRLSRIVKLVDSLRVLQSELLPALADGELVVMDRYLETHRAAASSQLCWNITSHPVLRCFPSAECTIWLDVPIEHAMARLSSRSRELSADEHASGLLGYVSAYAKMAEESDWLRLDACAPFTQNARAIDAALGLRHLRADVAEPEAALAPTTPELAEERARLTIGCGKGRLLGQQTFELRRFVQARIGAASAGIPESFWIEAYALQVALELWSGAGHDAQIAVWPEALAAMPIFRDLHTLREVCRLIEARAEVTAYATAGANAWFAELCPHPAPRARLLDDYGTALSACALARGWCPDPDSPVRHQSLRTRTPRETAR